MRKPLYLRIRRIQKITKGFLTISILILMVLVKLKLI